MLSKNLAKKIRALKQKKQRQEQGLFLVEGAKVVTELLQTLASAEKTALENTNLWQLEHLVATPEFLSSQAELLAFESLFTSKETLASENLLASEKIIATTPAELTALGSLSSNNSALAVVKIPPPIPPPQEFTDWVLVLDGINDPGNLGSLMRIADWYGVRHLVASAQSVEAYNPKVISASKGSFLRVHLSYTHLPAYLQTVAASGRQILAADLNGTNLHEFFEQAEQQEKQAEKNSNSCGLLVLGSEAQGLSPEVAKLAQQKILIPSFGQAESLNVGVAAAVILDNLRRVAAKKY